MVNNSEGHHMCHLIAVGEKNQTKIHTRVVLCVAQNVPTFAFEIIIYIKTIYPKLYSRNVCFTFKKNEINNRGKKFRGTKQPE